MSRTIPITILSRSQAGGEKAVPAFHRIDNTIVAACHAMFKREIRLFAAI